MKNVIRNLWIVHRVRSCRRQLRIPSLYASRFTNNGRTGFTIVEALVSVTILTTAIAGPLALLSRNITLSAYARDEATAVFLAQEAYDVIRHLRDNNALLNVPGTPWNPAGLGPTPACIGANGAATPVCYLDALRMSEQVDDALNVCPGGVCTYASHAVTYNSTNGLYQNRETMVTGAGISPTKFLRTVAIRRPTPAASADRELWVDVTVRWFPVASGPERSYTLRGILMRN